MKAEACSSDIASTYSFVWCVLCFKSVVTCGAVGVARLARLLSVLAVMAAEASALVMLGGKEICKRAARTE